MSDFQPDIMFSTYMTQSEFQYIYEVTIKAKARHLYLRKCTTYIKRYLRDIDAVFNILSQLSRWWRFEITLLSAISRC